MDMSLGVLAEEFKESKKSLPLWRVFILTNTFSLMSLEEMSIEGIDAGWTSN